MNKSITAILNQVSNIIGSILSGSKVTRIDDNGIQCSRDGEVYNNLQTVHQYGFYSKPPKGCDALLLSNGNKKSQVIIGTKKGAYPELNEGDSCLYSDKESLVKAPNIRLKGKKIAIGEGENELISILLNIIEQIPETTPKEGAPLIKNPKDWPDIKKKLGSLKL